MEARDRNCLKGKIIVHAIIVGDFQNNEITLELKVVTLHQEL